MSNYNFQGKNDEQHAVKLEGFEPREEARILVEVGNVLNACSAGQPARRKVLSLQVTFFLI